VLSDEQAIANLVLGYAEAVDLGDFEAVGAFFADATYRAAVGSDVYVLEGASAVTEQMTTFTRRYDDGTPRTRHVTTNLIIEIDDAGTGATCRSSYCVLQVVAGSLQPIIVGRYHDAFAKLDGAWRFTDRLVHTDLIGDLRWHLLHDLPKPRH
jgi:SnoaL-like domain